MQSKCFSNITAVSAALLCSASISLTTGVRVSAADPADVEGNRLMEEACTQCHGLYPVVNTRDGGPGWRDTVQKMVVAGAQLNTAEIDRMVDYLASAYGPGAGPMATGLLPADSALAVDPGTSSTDIELPAGDGKELVQGYCHMCHDLGRVAINRRTEADWRRYVPEMLAQGDLEASADDVARMVGYLTEHFGPVPN